MRQARTVVLFLVAELLVTQSASRADIHSGVALIPPGPSWDFSDSTLAVPPDGDLRWITIVIASAASNPDRTFPYYFACDAPAAIAYAHPDSSYENLTTAPADPGAYSEGKEILTYAVYVVRTKEGHFAKLRVSRPGGGMLIEYSYQDDGTRVLVRPVKIAPTTWGRIKCLYRQ